MRKALCLINRNIGVKANFGFGIRICLTVFFSPGASVDLPEIYGLQRTPQMLNRKYRQELQIFFS
jgi:hypothetical protein